MKILKGILFALLAVVATLLIVAAFLPSEYSVQRSIEIRADRATVYNSVIDYNNWKNWSIWVEMDPDAVNTMSGNPGEPGATWLWDGEIIGRGSLQLEQFKKNEMIRSTLTFSEPDRKTSTVIWNFKDSENGTLAIWINEGELDYPLMRYFGLFLDSMLGPDFEQGLANLKAYLESRPTTPHVDTMP